MKPEEELTRRSLHASRLRFTLCYHAILTPTPVACLRLRTSGSNGMLSGLWVFRVISQTNIAAAPSSAVSPAMSQRRALRS